ncbi:tetratricopeptide repeat protein [Sphingobacterium corticis]|uniref:Tetratricopeptide repeat protein n=1 Tax=Sphingobacterium corticis TaxID=1812823 RepID=A0ABW5NI45_9SPHI
MKTFFIALSLIMCQLAFAQNSYEKAMTEAMQLWEAGKTDEAAAKFERIASVEKKNWLPAYYQSLAYITKSFPLQDQTKRMELLQKATSIINEKQTLGSESEWLVLKAFVLTSEMITDPMNNAQKLSPKIIATYKKAIQADPENPRAIAGLAEFQIQSKRFTGGQTEQDYKDLEKALSLYDKDKTKGAFYPSWGKDRTEKMLTK